MEDVNTKFEEMTDDERAEFYRAYLNSSQEDINTFDKERLVDVMQDRGIDQKTAEKVIRDQNEVAKRLLWEKVRREKLEEKLKKEVRGTRQWSETEKEWKESKKDFESTESEEEILEPEESEATQDSRPDFLKIRNDLAQKIRKGEAIGKGILGVDSRRPLKEAIISGGAKILQSLKGKPKTPEDIYREHELRKARQEYEHEEALERIRNPPEPREREPSFRDLGRGHMGTPSFERSVKPQTSFRSTTPDFFGNSNQFMIGSNPMGTPTKRRISNVPPSTSIPSVKGRKPPGTKIVISKIKSPSTKLKTFKLKSIKIKPKLKIKEKINSKSIPVRIEKDIRKKQRRSDDFLGLSNYI